MKVGCLCFENAITVDPHKELRQKMVETTVTIFRCMHHAPPRARIKVARSSAGCADHVYVVLTNHHACVAATVAPLPSISWYRTALGCPPCPVR